MYGLLILGIIILSIGVVALILELIGQFLPYDIGQGLAFLGMFVMMFSVVVGGVLSGVSVARLKLADTEYYQFIETKEMVEYMIDPEQELANVDLTSTITEMNEWLVDAKWSQIRWGNWSMYCRLDLSDLEYITMKVGD